MLRRRFPSITQNCNIASTQQSSASLIGFVPKDENDTVLDYPEYFMKQALDDAIYLFRILIRGTNRQKANVLKKTIFWNNLTKCNYFFSKQELIYYENFLSDEEAL